MMRLGLLHSSRRCGARDLVVLFVSPYNCFDGHILFSRSFGTSNEDEFQESDKSDKRDIASTSIEKIKCSEIVYRGGLADATLRLKRVSITTCALGLVGMPLLALLYGSDVSSTGQMAVGGTAIFAATGSTAALTYCISPYVHLIERFEKKESRKLKNNDKSLLQMNERYYFQATTRDIFARERKTLFDPSKDISHDVGSRPFCNFIAKGVPMYVHPELIEDEKLRKQLVGDKAVAIESKKSRADDKDDDFL